MSGIDWAAIDPVVSAAPVSGGIDWSAIDQAAPAAVSQQPQPQQAPPSFMGSQLGGWIRGIRDIPDGMAQTLYNIEPSWMQSGLDKADAWLHNATGGIIGNQTGGTFNQKIVADNSAYEADRQANGRQGMDWARMGGNALGTLPLAAVAPAEGLLNAGLFGAAGNMAMPVTDNAGNFWAQKGLQGLSGAAGGVAGGLLAKGVGSALSPKLSPDVQSLLSQGVPLTPGQIMGGIPQSIESKATSIPFVGDMIKNAQMRGVQGMNQVALNRALSPIGETASGIGREGLDDAINKLGSAYDSTLAKIGAVKPDPQFYSDLGNLSQLTSNLPAERATQFSNIIKSNILDNINPQGYMTSDALQGANSKLGTLARDYMGSQSGDERQLGNALLEAQSTLRQSLARLSPDNAAQLSNINQGYANLLRVQRASSMAGTEKTGGVFTPAQLNSAVKNGDKSLNDRAYARGTALMQDLSGPATRVMGNNYPDSGTAGRSLLGWLASGAVGAALKPELAPYMAAGGGLGLLGALPYTKTGQMITQGLMTARPEISKEAGDLITKNAARAGLLTAPAFAGLLH